MRWLVGRDRVDRTVLCRNEGVDAARNVIVSLEVNGVRCHAESSEVSGDPIVIDASELLRRELHKHTQHAREMAASGIPCASSGAAATIKGKVLWQTDLGTWHEHDVLERGRL